LCEICHVLPRGEKSAAVISEYAVETVRVTGDEVHALAAGQGHEYAAVTEHRQALGTERAEGIGKDNGGRLRSVSGARC